MNDNPTDAKEQYELGEKYKGKYWSVNKKDKERFQKAVYWYTKAAEQGNADAMCSLGYAYRSGYGVPEDEEKAVYYFSKAVEQFTKAAEQGSAEAQYKLSYMYDSCVLFYVSTSEEILNMYKKHKYWLLKAVKQGYADAQYSLGCQYMVGRNEYGGGFQQDRKQAAYWCTAAAEQGHSEAQKDLGNGYAQGYGLLGLPKNLEKANYWYAKSAEQGNAEAQYRLGVNYYFGKGIPKDLEKARHWIALAAEDGNKEAEEALAKLDAGEPLASGCYIATCVYGSYDCPEVLTLRRFRDNELSNLWFGRCFIRIYYAVSPKIIELFGDKKWFGRLWKPIINKIVCKLQRS